MVNFFPDTLFQALEILDDQKVRIMGGGTDLMVRYRKGPGVNPDFGNPLLFTKGIKALQTIQVEGKELIIGSGVTLSQLTQHPKTPELLKKVILQMASVGIRSEATLAGNIANSSPAGDSLPYLYCLNAILRLANLKGTRDVFVSDFIKGPGKNDLAKNELITAIKLPLESFDTEIFRKIGGRRSDAISKLSFTGMVKRDGVTISDIRLAFGAVGPVVIRQADREKQLADALNKEDSSALEQVLSDYSGDITPIDDQRSSVAYRKKVTYNLLKSFIGSCLDE